MSLLRPMSRSSLRTASTALLVLTTAAPALARVNVLESDSRHVVLEVVPGAPRTEAVATSAGSYVRVSIPGFGVTGEVGAPEIPISSTRVAIPPNAVPRLVVREEEWSEPQSGAIVPAAERIGVREPFGVNRVVEREPRLDERFRSRAVMPATPFELSGVAGLRHLRTVSVIYHGARANMADRTYRLLKRAVLEVVFDEKAPDLNSPRGLLGPQGRLAPSDDLWEKTISGTVANADRSRPWRGGGPGDATLVGDTPWGAGTQWRILLPGTGIQRVTFQNLAAAGFPAGIDVDHLALYQRNFQLDLVDDPSTPAPALFEAVPVPIDMVDANTNGAFDTGDSFLMYGRSFRDQWMVSGRENEDLFGQDNFVWLRIDTAGGARMATVRPGGSLSGTATDSLGTTPNTILVEKDVRYYERPPDSGAGSRSFEAEFYYRNDSRSAADSALGWVLQSDTQPFDAFDVPDPAVGVPGALTLRVVGGGSPNDHVFTTRFESTLNEVAPPIAQKAFYNGNLYSGGIVPPANVLHEFTIPAGILVNGQNRLSFRGWTYRGNTTNPSFLFPNTRFYFDWFEVVYPRRLLARGDALALTTANGTPATLLIRVGGFGGNDVRLFDVSNPAVPANVGVTPAQIVSDGGGFALRFDHDNAASPGSYVAIRTSSIPPIASASISPVGAPTLLAGGSGARWVGLAHDSFLAGTQELAAHRSARMSAIAVPISQVWDTFGNGMRDPRAIKAYAAYAFHRWANPLVFLCLVGDASEDHRGVLTESDPDLVPSHSLHASYEGAPEESDQYYAEVTHGEPADPDGFDDLPDLYVGRIAVNTVEELDWNLERIRAYEAPSSGDELWRRTVLLTADDAFSGDLGIGFSEGYRYQGNETGFRESSDAYADTLEALPFDSIVPTKVYLSDFTMGCPDSCYSNDTMDCENGLGRECGIYYDCRNPDWSVEYLCMRTAARAAYLPALRERTEQGALIWNFEGHANKYFMTHEEIFRDDNISGNRDIDVLDNGGKPFIFLGFACHLAEFDNADEANFEDCLAEKFMNRRPTGEDVPGGAIASFASSGFEFLGPNLYFNEVLFDCFFHPERTMESGTLPDNPGDGGAYAWTLGESTTRSRLLYGDAFPFNPSFDRDHQAMLRFVLLGDPAVTPDSGTPEIRVTVNGAPVANGQFLDVPASAPVPIEISATVNHGRGITGLKVIDSKLGEVPTPELTIAVSDSSEHGVNRAMTLGYTHPLRADTYDLAIEATNERGAAGRFLLRVSSDLSIVDVTPFPNPFSDELRLYYRLTRGAEQVRARIFTISGRKIYETNTAPSGADVNVFTWDGRDDAGNHVANGTYLLALRASSPDGDSEATARIVKMR